MADSAQIHQSQGDVEFLQDFLWGEMEDSIGEHRLRVGRQGKICHFTVDTSGCFCEKHTVLPSVSCVEVVSSGTLDVRFG